MASSPGAKTYDVCVRSLYFVSPADLGGYCFVQVVIDNMLELWPELHDFDRDRTQQVPAVCHSIRPPRVRAQDGMGACPLRLPAARATRSCTPGGPAPTPHHNTRTTGKETGQAGTSSRRSDPGRAVSLRRSEDFLALVTVRWGGKAQVADMLQVIGRGANVKLDDVIAPKQDRADLIHGGHRRKYSSVLSVTYVDYQRI
jgi:hypothetical protein